MKNRIFLGAMALVALVGCGSGEGSKSNNDVRAFYYPYYNANLEMFVELPTLKGDVKSLTMTFSTAKEKFGELVKDDEMLRSEYEFTSAGNVCRHKEFYSSELAKVTKMEYNSLDKCTKSFEYSEDGELVEFLKCTYSEEGYPLGENYYDGDGELKYRLESECDKNGNPIVIREFNAEEKLTSLVRQKFNSDNKPTEYISYDAEGDVDYEIFLIYNSNGKLSRQLQRNYFEDHEYVYETVYKYDAKGNLIEQVDSSHNGGRTRYLFSYDKAGNMTEKVEKYSWKDEEERTEGSSTYEYDSKGNVTRYVVYEYEGARKKPRYIVDFEIEYR